MKCAVITPVGPGHEQLFLESQESIQLAYDTSLGPFSDILTISIDDTAGEIGRSAARNEAIRRAAAEDAEWIFFLDADDLLLPEVFQAVAPYIGKYDAIWGSIAEIKPGCQEAVLRAPQVSPILEMEAILSADPYRTLQIGHFVRTQLALENLFDENMDTGEDFDYHLRIWDQHKCIKIEAPLFVNRRGCHSVGPKSADGADWRRSVEATIDRYRAKYGITSASHSSAPPATFGQDSRPPGQPAQQPSKKLEKNLALIRKRWPQIFASMASQNDPQQTRLITDTPQPTLSIAEIHLSSAYDPRQEAEVQASLIPAGSTAAWIYGIGQGELQRVLLAREELEKLSVVILNPEVAHATFNYFDHSDWLSDPRVELLPGTEDQLGFPFAAIPPCLQLADDSSARLRDLVFLELATLYLNDQHRLTAPGIRERLSENEPLVRSDGDVASLFGSQSGATMMVAAAGPSLGEKLPWVAANRQRYPLIAVNSALKPLLAAGIIPDLVVAIDADPKIISCFQGCDLAALEVVPLVYFPRVPTAVLEIWPGPRLCGYADHPSYEEIASRLPRGLLYSSGSVLHPSVDLARRMGAEEIILLGADLAFPGGQRYTAGAGWDEQEIGPVAEHWVLDGHNNRVATIASFRGYLRDLERYIAQHPQVRFVNCSRAGAYIQGTRFLEERP